MPRFKYLAIAAAITSTFPAFGQANELPEVFVSAKRFEESTSAMPPGAIVLTAEQIGQTAASNVPEVLAKLAGVQVRNNAGSPNWQVDMRGFGMSGDQNTLILLDGQRLSENELTPALLAGIPLSSVVRIEVLPGSGSVLYGGGATGGTINIITEGARRKTTQGRIVASTGSYGTDSVQASLNAGSDNIALSLSAGQYDSDNYRVHNHVGEKNAQGELRFFGQDGDIRLKFGNNKETLELPGPRTAAQLDSNPRGTGTPSDKLTTDTSSLGLSGQYQTQWGELALDVTHREKHALANTVSWGSTTDTRTKNLTISPRFRICHDFPGQGGELVVGIDHSDWEFSTNDTFTGRGKAEQTINAFYFQEDARLSTSTRLGIGARWQTTTDTFTLPARQQRTSDQTAYEIRLSHALNQYLSLYGKTGESFRTGTVNENYNIWTGTINFLRPQTSRDVEVGTEFTFTRGKFRLAYFQSDITNEIHYMNIDPWLFGANTNLSPTRREGFELDGKWQLAENFSISGNYRYTEAKFRSGVYGGVSVSNKEVPLVPRQLLTVNAAWKITDRDQLSSSLRYVGQQRYDNDQVNAMRSMPSYTLLDLKYKHTMGDWAISGSIDNVTDKRYYSYGIRNAAGTSFNAYPELGRRVMATLEYTFK